MSENQNRRVNSFSKYDEMSTDELEQILRLDAESTEGQESDTETLLYIMEVLTKRRKNNGHTGNTAQEAYESFKQHYMPEIDCENHVPANENASKIHTFRWIRTLAATAAVLVIVIFGSVTAKAFGIDVWKAVIQWTQETFHFGDWDKNNEPHQGDTTSYTSLQDALEQGEVTASLVPTWFPDGYELIDVTVELNPMKRIIRATYMNGEQVLKVTIQNYLKNRPVYVEQSEGLVEEYIAAGITYYLFSDNDVVKAVWVNGSYECDIFGCVTIEELKLMIDSIEKG